MSSWPLILLSGVRWSFEYTTFGHVDVREDIAVVMRSRSWKRWGYSQSCWVKWRIRRTSRFGEFHQVEEFVLELKHGEETSVIFREAGRTLLYLILQCHPKKIET